MPYKAIDYSRLFQMTDFSHNLLDTHFTLYRGYVEQTNKLLETLSTIEKNAKDPKYAELKRRFGWEFNGMRLHEYYFNNLGGKSGIKESPVKNSLQQHFSSFEEWEKDFAATGAMRGIGWAVLYYDPQGERLFNTWINEHDVSHLAGCSPILVLDVFEHAFMLDFGMKRDQYIDAFMRNVRWDVVAERFDAARQGAAAPALV
jgi:Fe-Mn family superoxide dismutase